MTLPKLFSFEKTGSYVKKTFGKIRPQFFLLDYNILIAFHFESVIRKANNFIY